MALHPPRIHPQRPPKPQTLTSVLLFLSTFVSANSVPRSEIAITPAVTLARDDHSRPIMRAVSHSGQR